MKIIFGVVKFLLDKKINFLDLEKLRGNMIRMYRENIKAHNHSEDGKSIYNFPEFQYKIIDGKLSIMLFNENVNFLLKVYSEIDDLIFNQDKFEVRKEIEIKDYEISYLGEEYRKYKFISFYLPFNQENFKKYLSGKYTLENAITNNILEFLKGINFFLEKEKRIKIKNIVILKEEYILSKSVKFKGIKCTFETNVDLPSYISLGKRKSIGFGVIKKI